MIGKLNRRVTFQSRSRTPDGAGGNTYTWGSDTTVWAGFRTARGREQMVSGRTSNPGTAVVTIRAGSVSVDHSMRMQYGGRNYNVRDVTEVDEGNRFVEVLVELDVPT